MESVIKGLLGVLSCPALLLQAHVIAGYPTTPKLSLWWYLHLVSSALSLRSWQRLGATWRDYGEQFQVSMVEASDGVQQFHTSTQDESQCQPFFFSRGVQGIAPEIVMLPEVQKRISSARQMPCRSIPEVFGVRVHTWPEDRTGTFDSHAGVRCRTPTRNPRFPRTSFGTLPPQTRHGCCFLYLFTVD